MDKIRKFLKEIKAEIKKVTWTGKKEVISGTVAVLILCGVVSLFLLLSDVGISFFLRLIFG